MRSIGARRDSRAPSPIIRLHHSVKARTWNAIPSRYIAIVLCARAVIGISSLMLAPYCPFYYLGKAMAFGGKMFVFLAIYGLIMHAESHVMDVVVRAVDLVQAWLKQGRRT